MAGLTFDTLFERGMEYDDSGKGLIIAPMESASIGKLQINEYAFDTGSSANETIVTYEVPAGKVAYIVTCLLRCTTDGVNTGWVEFAYNRGGVVTILNYTIAINTLLNEYHTFPMALKFIAGDVINIRKPTNCSAGGNFTGWVDDA